MCNVLYKMVKQLYKWKDVQQFFTPEAQYFIKDKILSPRNSQCTQTLKTNLFPEYVLHSFLTEIKCGHLKMLQISVLRFPFLVIMLHASCLTYLSSIKIYTSVYPLKLFKVVNIVCVHITAQRPHRRTSRLIIFLLSCCLFSGPSALISLHLIFSLEYHFAFFLQ